MLGEGEKEGSQGLGVCLKKEAVPRLQHCASVHQILPAQAWVTRWKFSSAPQSYRA
jgi:hypothetical protein